MDRSTVRAATARKTKQRAFTLTEMLVVLGVIAVLAALLLPVLAIGKRRARATQCANNVRQIGIASTLYTGEYQDIIVPMARKVSAVPGDRLVPYEDYLWWPDNLKHYLNGRAKVLTCPDVPVVQAGQMMSNAFGIGMNFNELGVFPEDVDPATGAFVRLSSVRNPAETVIFGDVAYVTEPYEKDADKWVPDLSRQYTWNGFGVWLFETPAARNDQWNYNCTRIINRHDGRANCAFVDGHAERVKTSALGWQYGRGDVRAKWDR